MHELSIAESILDIINNQLREYPNAFVKRVKLRVGMMSNIVPDALRFAFEIASQGKVTEHAELEIELVPASIYCFRCQKKFEIKDPFLICPNCENLAVELISGKELELFSLEIEDGH